MSGNTVNEGYPYPLTSDFADVQDAFRLVTAIDVDMRSEQAPFRNFMGRPSFIARSTVTPSGAISGTFQLTVGATDWDNTGGVYVNGWNQPLSQPPSWWMFGATILVANTGTPVVGEMTQAQIAVSTADPVTAITSVSNAYQRNDESNTGGEWLNVYTMAAVYQGSVAAYLNLNGSTTKSLQLGSRLWGLYLGPVN